ncbi:hypothetical protein C2W62_44480 [Candidatus Entotheonella serta]|nr:hypothetical protein C2W62_44480 [Candidatus Entotheonella serta]
MPNIAEQLASYSTNLYYRDRPSGTAHLAKRMMIDTIACALKPNFDHVTVGGIASILVAARSLGRDQE